VAIRAETAEDWARSASTRLLTQGDSNLKVTWSLAKKTPCQALFWGIVGTLTLRPELDAITPDLSLTPVESVLVPKHPP
jgi:hypothetical protein